MSKKSKLIGAGYITLILDVNVKDIKLTHTYFSNLSNSNSFDIHE